MIAELTQYTDDKGRQITEFRDIVTAEIHFRGQAMFNRQVRGGIMQVPFVFPIDAEDITEAYEGWDEAAKPAAAKVEAELLKQAAPGVQRAPGGILDDRGGLIRARQGRAGGNGDRIR